MFHTINTGRQVTALVHITATAQLDDEQLAEFNALTDDQDKYEYLSDFVYNCGGGGYTSEIHDIIEVESTTFEVKS